MWISSSVVAINYLRFLNFDENSLRPILSFLDPARCSNHDGVFFLPKQNEYTLLFYPYQSMCRALYFTVRNISASGLSPSSEK